MSKKIVMIFGLNKEAAQSTIERVLSVGSEKLNVVKYTYDEPNKALAFVIALLEGEDYKQFNIRFSQLTDIIYFKSYNHYPKWFGKPVEVCKPKRRSFFKFIIDCLF